jgi:hypothetical protein
LKFEIFKEIFAFAVKKTYFYRKMCGANVYT